MGPTLPTTQFHCSYLLEAYVLKTPCPGLSQAFYYKLSKPESRLLYWCPLSHFQLSSSKVKTDVIHLFQRFGDIHMRLLPTKSTSFPQSQSLVSRLFHKTRGHHFLGKTYFHFTQCFADYLDTNTLPFSSRLLGWRQIAHFIHINWPFKKEEERNDN